MREEIEGAFNGLDLIFRRSIGLKLQEPHFESQSEIGCRCRQHAQQIVQSLLFATGAPAIAEIEVVAKRLVGKVKMPDPSRLPVTSARTKYSSRLSGLGHITDWDEVGRPLQDEVLDRERGTIEPLDHDGVKSPVVRPQDSCAPAWLNAVAATAITKASL